METKFINFKQFSHDHSFLSVPKPKKVVFDSLKEEDEIDVLIKKHKIELKNAREFSYKTGYDAGKETGYEAGYNEGHDIGFNKAITEARTTFQNDLKRLQIIVNGITSEIESEKNKMIDEMKKIFPELMWELIFKFFDENKEKLADTLLKRLETTLDTLLSEPGCEIRLNPEDVKTVRANINISDRGIGLIQDDEVNPGSFIINTKYSEIDGRIDKFLEKVYNNFNE